MQNTIDLSNELSMVHFNKFLNDVKQWELLNPHSDIQEKEFLKNLLLSKEMESLPSIEEITQKNLKLSIDNFVAKTKFRRKKWIFEEKEILVWVVYFYSLMKKKHLDEMVLMHLNSL